MPETDNAFDAAFEEKWQVYSRPIKLLNPLKMKAICQLFFADGANYVCDKVEATRTEIFDAT
ncbi:hypothetical protein LCGC14_1557730 [marine sediment metagenome]|uniref:Uncharacterized protein n=1 Tax=marine sediment metagenome TaxID=412755 RepID=A0A0F9L4R6_9ZZZZ